MFIILIINSRPRLTGATCFYTARPATQLHYTSSLQTGAHGTDLEPDAHCALTSRLVRHTQRSAARQARSVVDSSMPRGGEMGSQVHRKRCIHFQRVSCVSGDEERTDWRKKTQNKAWEGCASNRCLFGKNAFRVVECHPKTASLQQAARNGTSQRNALSLHRKQHITASGLENSTLREVTVFWGQHSHSLGAKLTPQLDLQNMCERTRVCAFWRTCGHVRECVCVHTQLCFFNDTYSHIPSPKKTG